MFDEAERRYPAGGKRWVVLLDGNQTQLDVVRSEAKRRGREITIIYDIVNVIEYVWSAGWCFCEPGDAAAEAWVGERLLQFLQRGRASDVAAGIRRRATLRKLTK